MVKYNPQSEIPVELSQDEIDYLKELLISDAELPVCQAGRVLNPSIMAKLEKFQPSCNPVKTSPYCREVAYLFSENK